MGDAGGFVAYAAEAVLEHDADQLSISDEQQWFTIDAQGRHAPFDMRLHSAALTLGTGGEGWLYAPKRGTALHV
nr:hypothetical protein [uncultured Brevundimonas sp.]